MGAPWARAGGGTSPGSLLPRPPRGTSPGMPQASAPSWPVNRRGSVSAVEPTAVGRGLGGGGRLRAAPRARGAGWPFAPGPAGGAGPQGTPRRRAVRGQGPGAGSGRDESVSCPALPPAGTSLPLRPRVTRGGEGRRGPRRKHVTLSRPHTRLTHTHTRRGAPTGRHAETDTAADARVGTLRDTDPTRAHGHSGAADSETRAAPAHAQARRDLAPPPYLHAQSTG